MKGYLFYVPAGRRRLPAWTLTLLLAGLLAPLAQAQRTLIYCGTVLDPGVSMTPVAEKTLVIEGKKIAAVEDGYLDPRSDDTVIDLRDQYVMPGLMDMHVHLSSESRKNGHQGHTTGDQTRSGRHQNHRHRRGSIHCTRRFLSSIL